MSQVPFQLWEGRSKDNSHDFCPLGPHIIVGETEKTQDLRKLNKQYVSGEY